MRDRRPLIRQNQQVGRGRQPEHEHDIGKFHARYPARKKACKQKDSWLPSGNPRAIDPEQQQQAAKHEHRARVVVKHSAGLNSNHGHSQRQAHSRKGDQSQQEPPHIRAQKHSDQHENKPEIHTL